jgi:REP element-mobilizing transposase RayT
MHLNDLGQFASECLHNISVYSQCATVINQIVMPNHVHAIIELKNETPEHLPNKFGPLLKNSLGSVVNHFKGRVTRYARANNIDYGWQSLYHDHIIRNGLEYQRIFNYIDNNPRNWKLDTNNQ